MPPYNVLYGPNGSVPLWYYMGESTIYGTDGVVHTDITPASWSAMSELNQGISFTLNTLPIFNNTIDAPVYTTGETVQCLPLPDWPVDTTCEALRPYRNFLVAMNISGPGGNDADYLQWSDAAAAGLPPQSWTPEINNQAGNNVIGDTTGRIIDGLTLRGDFVIYKEDSTH